MRFTWPEYPRTLDLLLARATLAVLSDCSPALQRPLLSLCETAASVQDVSCCDSACFSSLAPASTHVDLLRLLDRKSVV